MKKQNWTVIALMIATAVTIGCTDSSKKFGDGSE